MNSEQQTGKVTATRRGAAGKSYFRSERTVFINGDWYFLNRETSAEGPFTSKEDADEAVERYVKLATSPLFEAKELERINALTRSF